jgi:hypothetical protein
MVFVAVLMRIRIGRCDNKAQVAPIKIANNQVNGGYMIAIEEKTEGYVYILEVKDIDLPVCKIGMTTRNPYERCAEINNSSTGDFVWAVAYHIAVDNCKNLESLVHSKLAPLRQRGREFFNINADDAIKALSSIIDSQSEIKKIDGSEIVDAEKKRTLCKK